MGQFDEMKQADLQQACKDRGLPAGGTNDELKARLEQFETEAAALRGDDDEGTPPDAPSAPPVAPPTPPEPPPAPTPPLAAEAPPEPLRAFLAEFPCPAELSTQQHLDYRLMAYNQALEAGHTPRGGLAGVYRSGWRVVAGVRHGVYTVPLRR